MPWEVEIPPGERDDQLGDRLALEHDFVLTWLVAGCMDWRRNGLADPQAVVAATET